MAQTKRANKSSGKSNGLSSEERAAMKERARELKGTTGGESEVLAKIAEMPNADRELATGFHELIKKTAPGLAPRTWYGMPAYAKDGKVVCHFKNASKFKTRYATVGFSDKANLDEGDLWPTEFALKELTPAVEKQLAALVTRAIS